MKLKVTIEVYLDDHRSEDAGLDAQILANARDHYCLLNKPTEPIGFTSQMVAVNVDRVTNILV